MGTNYFFRQRGPGPHPRLHIGMAQDGYAFLLRIHPHENIRHLADWQMLWPNGIVFDSFQNEVTAEEMHRIITERGEPAELERYESTPKLMIDARGITYDICRYDFR